LKTKDLGVGSVVGRWLMFVACCWYAELLFAPAQFILRSACSTRIGLGCGGKKQRRTNTRVLLSLECEYFRVALYCVNFVGVAKWVWGEMCFFGVVPHSDFASATLEWHLLRKECV